MSGGHSLAHRRRKRQLKKQRATSLPVAPVIAVKIEQQPAAPVVVAPAVVQAPPAPVIVEKPPHPIPKPAPDIAFKELRRAPLTPDLGGYSAALTAIRNGEPSSRDPAAYKMASYVLSHGAVKRA
jgi:hypothetical protein